MNQMSIYWLKYYWNLLKFALCFVFVFYHKDVEVYFIGEYHSVEDNEKVMYYHLAVGAIWISLFISSFLKLCHYRIVIGQGHEDTPFKYDWSIMGMARTFFKFITEDFWEARKNKDGIEGLKKYRESKTKIMSQHNAAKEYLSSSSLDAIDNSGNKRVRDYVNTRINTMSNERALKWIKNDMKD